MTDLPVIARIEGGWGRLTLNRPAALHALNTQIRQNMARALLAWREDPAVQAVMLDHKGPRGFCAGGSIRLIMESGAQDGAAARAFFAEEYRLNTLLFGYDKPVVAIMDGVLMGGGVGISAPATYRVATERTVFAMPETGIGLFPDVGGGWFLPRLVGETGIWLALTGARLKAADCLLLGLATDYVPQAEVEELTARLLADPRALDMLLTESEADAGEPPLAHQRGDIGPAVRRRQRGGHLRRPGGGRRRLGASPARHPGDQVAPGDEGGLSPAPQGRDMLSFKADMAVEYRIAARVSAMMNAARACAP